VTVGSSIYLIGGIGRDGQVARPTERYDLATNTWTILPSSADLPTYLQPYAIPGFNWFPVAATAVGTEIFAIAHGNGAVAVFDTTTLTWRATTSSGFPLASRPATYRCPYDPAVTVQNGPQTLIVMMGCGNLADGGPSAIMEYDPGANVWTNRGPLPSGAMQAEHVAVAVGTRVVTFGGDWPLFGDAIVQFDAAAGTALLSPTRLMAGRSDLAGGMIGGRMYLIGGIVPGTIDALVPSFEISDP
jgi:hypothetical protein